MASAPGGLDRDQTAPTDSDRHRSGTSLGPVGAGDSLMACAVRCRIQAQAQTIRESIWTNADRSGAGDADRTQETLYNFFRVKMDNSTF